MTTTIHVIRHAKAADRERWTGNDLSRPLTRGGQRQAEALCDRLSVAFDPVRVAIASSPATRCRETLEPFAQHLGAAIASVEQLAEGSSPIDALAAMRALCPPDLVGAAGGGPSPISHVVACTHGDVMWGLLDELEPGGLLQPAPTSVPKACTIEIDLAGEAVLAARYLPPPTTDRKRA